MDDISFIYHATFVTGLYIAFVMGTLIIVLPIISIAKRTVIDVY